MPPRSHRLFGGPEKRKPKPIPIPVSSDPNSLSFRFWQFHEKNPHVYVELVRLVRLAMSRGRKRVGIGELWEILRWNLTMETEAPDGFKLNNNHRSRYSRLIMEQENDLKNVFEVRGLQRE